MLSHKKSVWYVFFCHPVVMCILTKEWYPKIQIFKERPNSSFQNIFYCCHEMMKTQKMLPYVLSKYSQFLENNVMQHLCKRLFEMFIIIYRKSQESTHKSYTQKNNWLIRIPKIIVLHVFVPQFCPGDTLRYVTVPRIQIESFLHLTSRFFRQCPKCIVFMLVTLCNQECNSVHVTWCERQRFILDIDTDTFL